MLKLQSDTKEFTKNALAFMEKDKLILWLLWNAINYLITQRKKKLRKEKLKFATIKAMNLH